jgi:hypothetical protein
MLDVFDIPMKSKLGFTCELFFAELALEEWSSCRDQDIGVHLGTGVLGDTHSSLSVTSLFHLNFTMHFNRYVGQRKKSEDIYKHFDYLL